jgi:ClpP class serine protease
MLGVDMWLLEPTVKQNLEKALEAGMLPSADHQLFFESERTSSAGRLLKYKDGVAQIEINGVLTKNPDIFALIFGGGNTTYSEMLAAIAKVESNDDVKSVEFLISSPGGNLDGLIETMDAIKSMGKPTKAIVKSMAASAAYGIASQTDKIEAFNRASMIGSVGTAIQARIDESVVNITNTESPKKRPDLTTEEGIKVVQQELDSIHDIFAGSIADGRGVSVSTVNAEFGKGATLVANDALKRGMIDSIADPKLKVIKNTNSTTAQGGNKNEANAMDLKTLQAQHPDVYEAAVKLGADQERDRVTAHLTMGEASGDMVTASEAIKDGSGMTATLQAKYMTAGMNRSDIQARQEDESGLEGTANLSDTDESSESDQVVNAVLEKMGVEV